VNDGNIDLVCFDLGRVLIRICDGWQHACAVAGVPIQARELDLYAAGALHDIVVRSEIGQIDLEQFAQAASGILGLPAAQVCALSNAYLLGAYPGAVELLEDLSVGGVKTACLSNTNVNHWRIICDPSAVGYFPLDRLNWRFASHLVGARKPQHEIYEHVERETGVTPGRILFFDDVAENIDAAVARGWIGRKIDPMRDPIAQARAELERHGLL